MRASPLITWMVVAAAVAGCSGKDEPRATTPTTMASSPSPTPLPTGDPAATAELVTIASKAAKAKYDATYEFLASNVRAKGTLRIYASPPRYRVDITIGQGTLQFFELPSGAISCQTPTGGSARCSVVAKAGEQAPDSSDPGVQRLFTEGLDALARDPEGFAITRIARSESSGVAKDDCFRVIRLADLAPVTAGTVTAPGKGFDTGDYCFDKASSVLTAAQLASGSLTLQTQGPPPGDEAFEPPATPQSLP
jgi:hypothetical protein